MAKHGYEVRKDGSTGYFVGVCGGHAYAPLQVERKIADQIVSQCRTDAVKLDAKAAALEAGEIFPALVSTNEYDHKAREFKKIPFDQADSYAQEKAVKLAIYRAQGRARAARGHADELEALADRLHGQPLREVAIEAGPAQVQIGEKRKTTAGRVLVAASIERGRVYWKDERADGKVFKSWTGIQTWRRLEVAA